MKANEILQDCMGTLSSFQTIACFQCFYFSERSGKLEQNLAQVDEMRWDVSLVKDLVVGEGTFHWVVDNFRAKRSLASMEKLKCVHSREFYSHPNGYKMRLEIYPFGAKNNGDVGLGLQLMRGPYDDQLTWPYSRQTYLCILHPAGGSNVTQGIDTPSASSPHWNKPGSECNPAYTIPMLTYSKLAEYLWSEKLVIAVKIRD